MIKEQNDLWNQVFKVWPEAMTYQSTPVFKLKRLFKRP